MEIIYLPTLLSSLKAKYLLLDTNIFRDSSVQPTAYNEFFNVLKKANVTLATTDFVKYELLKGSSDTNKYEAKETLVHNVVDVLLPISPNTIKLGYELITRYGIEGTALHVTDLLLGALLMQYKESMRLLTRDISDFIPRIFDLQFVVNAPHGKGIFTYGIYQYKL